MIPRPTSYATWASGVSGFSTEPLATDKNLGFVPTGIARAEYFNWLHNAAGQWHQYLDEHQQNIEQYQYAIDDDFAFGDETKLGLKATGIFPNWWNTSAGPTLADVSYVRDNGFDSGIGTINLDRVSSGVGFITSAIDGPSVKDFQFESRTQFATKGGSGSMIEIGAVGCAWFGSTGTSGTWRLNYQPTGVAGPTSLAIGVNPIELTRYDTFKLERLGSTMTYEIRNKATGAVFVGTGALGSSGTAVGIKVKSIGGPVNVASDYIKYGSRRR